SQLANWYGDKKQYSCAIETIHAGLKRDPKSAELLYLLGLDLLRKDDFDAALEPLQQSIQLKPNVLKPHLLLATALEQVHRPVDARKEWLAAVKVDPHSEIALDGASKNLLATKDYAEVVQLLGPQPKGEDLIADLASAYEGFGDQAQAADLLENALKANPSSGTLTRAMVTLLASQSRFVEAAQLSKKLAQNNPQDLPTQILYLHMLVMERNENEGRPLAQKLLVAAPHNFGVLYLNGLLERWSGDYEASRTHLEEAVSLNPNESSGHFDLGVTLARLQDWNGARAQFEKALALGATNRQVRFEYAKVLRALGETKLAAEQFQLYQKNQQEDMERAQASVKTAQGDKELASGDSRKAIELYREALEATPSNAMLNFKLSVALDRVGDESGEIEALKKAVQLDPQMAVAHYQLGYLASVRGDFALAENQYGEAVKAAPQYVQAWIGLAATLGTESRFPEAKQAVANALKLDPQNGNAIELQRELEAGAAQANQ